MTKEEFWIVFDLNQHLYFSSIGIALLLNTILLYPLLRSFFHPLSFYYVINYSFASAAVYFLYSLSYIRQELAVYFFLAQFLFIVGCYVAFFLKRDVYQEKPRRTRDDFCGFVYTISSLIFISFTILTYLYFGIPALEGSRWELYQSIPGAGIIGRFLEAAKYCIVFWLSYKYFRADKVFNYSDSIILLFLVASGFLSGSKMAVFEYIFIGYTSYIFIRHSGSVRDFKFNLSLLFFMAVGLLASISVIYVNQLYVNGEATNPLALVFERFVMSGDLQIMGYSNDVIYNLNIPPVGIFEAVFLDFKTLLNVLGVGFNSRSLGLEVMYYNYPYLDGLVNMGPATTFETYYLFYFGLIPGLFLSLMTGLIIGFFFFKRNTSGSTGGALLSSALAFYSILIIYNPQIAMGKIFFFLIYFFSFKLLYSSICVLQRSNV